MPIEPGTKLGRYEIRSMIGAGGMGEVYLARDPKLGRDVALKLLPTALASDKDRLSRFVQEARSASGLNHPHIITIYEIEETNDPPFIATEFIQGETLRSKMSGSSIRFADMLEIVIQIASALSAAHNAGIIHRDIKPENVMVRTDGYAKVLDFGLAKLSEAIGAVSIDREAATRNLVKTDPGSIMGTVSYMSPEQARGLPVDARTDLWSLGVVLYEMVTGRVPFEGETPTDTILAIVGKEPAPLSRYDPTVPEALEWVITKALTKEKEDRYQTARDMSADLKRLKQRLESKSGEDRFSENQLTVEHTPAHSDNAVDTSPSAPISTVSTVSSAEYLVNQLTNHKKKFGIIAAVALLVISALAYGSYRLLRSDRSGPSEKQMKITRLTTDGVSGAVTISPDGKYVVHSTTDLSGSNRSLWIRQVATNSSVQIVPPAAGRFVGTTFSPDGDHIYYSWVGQQDAKGTLYEIPTLGGTTPRLVLDDVSGAVTFDPDAKHFAFQRGDGELWAADLDGSNQRLVSKVDSATLWFADAGPSWSPDGKTIAIGMGTSLGGLRMMVAAIPASGGEPHPITDHSWNGNVERVVWLRDGSGLIANATNDPVIGTQVWFIPYPNGPVRRITNDLNGYGTFSLGITNDGNLIATVQEDASQQIWTATVGDDEGKAKQVNTGKYDAQSLAWTPDGRIVFVRRTGEATDVWIMKADGSEQRQLTKDTAFETDVNVTPDGRFIVFVSDRSGLPHIWRMNLDGSEPRQLTVGNEVDDGNPHISPDSRWVAFNSWKTNKYAPYLVSIDGGEMRLLHDGWAIVGAFTTDGKSLICNYLDQTLKPPRRRPAVLSIEDGQPKIIEGEFPPELAASVPFASDGKQLYFTRDRNIWSVPLTGGIAKELTNFKSRTLFRGAISPDGKKFALARGEITDDVVLIRDFK